MSGTLFVVGTPIGNLDDVTIRAAEVLRAVGVCYAEDTRRTRKLLDHLGARTPIKSLHQHNEQARVEEILEQLRSGVSLALVSDAGTPTISDPGCRVLQAVLDEGGSVSPIPGPSAVVSALSVSGFSANQFAFVGFPPRRGKARDAWISDVVSTEETVVVFEAPRRLVKLLDDLVEAGIGTRQAVICRELTKLHEEVVPGTVTELATIYGEGSVKGEVTIVVSGAVDVTDAALDLATIRESSKVWAREGTSRRDIAERLVREFGIGRNLAYRLSIQKEEGSEDE